jgi:hypothetical protein
MWVWACYDNFNDIAMIKIQTLQGGLRGVAELIFTQFPINGAFHFGWREDANRIKMAEKLQIIAEWPRGWRLQPPSELTSMSRGVIIKQTVLFGMKADNEFDAHQTIDRLQQIALIYFQFLNQLSSFMMPELHKGLPLDILPKGFTTDNSIWLMVQTDMHVYDCDLPPFPSELPDLALSPPTSYIENIFTKEGQIIYADKDLEPAVLDAGTEGQVLTISDGLPKWV